MPLHKDAVVTCTIKLMLTKPIFTAGKGQDQRKVAHGQPAEIRLLKNRHILNLHMGTLCQVEAWREGRRIYGALSP
jgi:hypothetical protein